MWSRTPIISHRVGFKIFPKPDLPADPKLACPTVACQSGDREWGLAVMAGTAGRGGHPLNSHDSHIQWPATWSVRIRDIPCYINP